MGKNGVQAVNKNKNVLFYRRQNKLHQPRLNKKIEDLAYYYSSTIIIKCSEVNISFLFNLFSTPNAFFLVFLTFFKWISIVKVNITSTNSLTLFQLMEVGVILSQAKT